MEIFTFYGVQGENKLSLWENFEMKPMKRNHPDPPQRELPYRCITHYSPNFIESDVLSHLPLKSVDDDWSPD
jgi:hypothetical protein